MVTLINRFMALLITVQGGSDLSELGLVAKKSGPEVIKLEYSLKLKIKRNDWLLADTCPQAANQCVLF